MPEEKKQSTIELLALVLLSVPMYLSYGTAIAWTWNHYAVPGWPPIETAQAMVACAIYWMMRSSPYTAKVKLTGVIAHWILPWFMTGLLVLAIKLGSLIGVLP